MAEIENIPQIHPIVTTWKPEDHQNEADPTEYEFVTGQPYVVKWLDSGMIISEGWAPVADHMRNWKLDNMYVESVGRLVYDDGDVIGLGLSFSEANGTGNEAVFGLQLIFKANIVEASHISVSE